MKRSVILSGIALAALTIALAAGLKADDDNHDYGRFEFKEGTLVLSRSKYVGKASTITVGEVLPPGCVPVTVVLPVLGSTTKTTSVSVTCGSATYDGTFPTVFNNDNSDGSFGITSPIFLDNITTDGELLGTLPIPTDQIVTSFSSKSELALNRSTDGKSITFMGYRGGPGFLTAPNQLDVSATNTPGLIDPTNPSVGQYYRSVAEVDAHGNLQITEGNPYSGDNGRAAIKVDSLYYMVGNDNNGGLSKTQLPETQVGVDLINDTGAELLYPGQAPPVPPNVNKIGNFSITEVIDPATGMDYTPADKPGKDNNFRGLTVFDNTVYITKGSGSNGINTVYQVGTAGTLPTGATADLAAEPITILPGFPTGLAGGVDSQGNTLPAVLYPFGIWFADANTLYVADEGDGYSGGLDLYTHAAAETTSGLQKWIYNSSSKSWGLAYTLQKGLDLGVPYTVPGFPTGLNLATCVVASAPAPNPNNCPVSTTLSSTASAPDGLPWAPATGGLRNITGRVNWDGTVTIWAVTSTISGDGDQGADPNKLVAITDELSATTLPKHEKFEVVRKPRSGDVLRGIAFAPSDDDYDQNHDHDYDHDQDHGGNDNGNH